MAYQIPSDQLIPKILHLSANPIATARMMLRTLEAATDGEIVMVDPTNPVAFLLDSAIVLSSAQMLQAETLTRKQYGSMALSMDDLYRHMSDKDYLGRFSTPSRGTVTMLFMLEEIKLKADFIRNSQGLPDGTGIRKLTIPKHTEFYVAGFTFVMQYAIDIRVMPHGGIQVVYDISTTSPFYKLESNRVDHGISRQGQYQFLRITLPVLQLAVNSQIAQMNNTTGFSKRFVTNDQFYYCRAYVKSTADSAWTEIKTTHTDQVFDPRAPTVLLKVLENSVDVSVPQIYFNTGLIRDSLRLDIYTTKGDTTLNLGSFKPEAFTCKYIDRDDGVDSSYVKPLLTFSGRAILSESVVTGGSNGIDFSTLRERVITQGLSAPTVPVSENQLINTAAGAGYHVVKSIDNVTNRVFLATRALPEPDQTVINSSVQDVSRTTVTSAGCTVQTLQASLENLAAISTITDNNNRLTIKPNTLFKSNNGVLSVVPLTTTQSLLNTNITPPNALAYHVNNAVYYYTPFFYVLDTDEDTFSSRAYRLDAPDITSKSFFAENAQLGIEVSTANYAVYCDLDKNQYTVVLRLAVGDTFTENDLAEYAIQLSYTPPGSSIRVFYTGTITLSTDEDNVDQYYATFNVATKFDVDNLHRLILEPYRTTAELITEFDLVYFMSNPPVDAPLSDLDDYIDPTVLDTYDETFTYRAIMHEKLTIHFGDALDKLWTKSRTVASTRVIATYDADVYNYYTEDILERDQYGNIVFDWDSGSQTLTQHILHYRGDPVLDSLGNHTKLHTKGSPVLDGNGNVTYLRDSRTVERQTDLVLLDGRYYFATDETTLAYRTTLLSLLTQWVSGDLDEIAGHLFENTKLYFYPKVTAGNVPVYVANKQLITINADQTFFVEYYLTEEKYKNEHVKASIAKETPKIISDVMANDTVSVLDILDRFRLMFGDDIVSAKVTSDILGESDTTTTRYQAFTVKDQSVRPNVGKQLLALSNLKLTVVDAVNISFVLHK